MNRTQEQIIERDILEIKERLIGLKTKITGKTFVISGGVGFLGSWFCEVAIRFGANVICIDNLITSTEENISNLENFSNFSFINSAIENANIPTGADYVIHMASIAAPPLYQRSPIETLNSGVLGAIKLLNYASTNNIRAYLFASTSEVYGDPPCDKIPTDEAYPGIVYSPFPQQWLCGRSCSTRASFSSRVLQLPR